MNKHSRLEQLLRGCSHCSYEEDDGSLYRHCQKCQYEITKLTYEIVIDDRKKLETKGSFSNGLTPAEEEMFQLTEEECAELIQAISKIRRYGTDPAQDPTGDGEGIEEGPRMQNLHEECGDVLACIAVLSHNRLVDIKRVNVIARQKLDRIRNPSTRRVHFITPEMIP